MYIKDIQERAARLGADSVTVQLDGGIALVGEDDGELLVSTVWTDLTANQ
jgi:hypothetical protein